MSLACPPVTYAPTLRTLTMVSEIHKAPCSSPPEECMIAVRRLLLGFIAVFGLAGLSFAASASNIYVTQNGSPAGNCKSNVQSAAWLNSPANWGSGATQVG